MSAFSTSIYSRRRKQHQLAKVKNTRRITTDNQIISAVESADVLNINNLTVTGSIGTGNSSSTSITVKQIFFTFPGITSGEAEIVIPDGFGEGLVIRDDSPQDLLRFDSLNDTIEPRVPIQFTNSSGSNEFIVPNSQAEALVIRNVANTVDFLRIDSTAGNLEIPVTIDTNTITAFTGDLDLTSSSGSIVLDGGEAVSDAIQLTASNAAGGITLATGSGGVNFPKATVTQITSLTTSVTVDSTAGVITTVSATLIAEASAIFTVNNDRVVAASVVLANVADYGGTYTTNGLPTVNVDNVTGGSFDIVVFNAHSSNALSGVLEIAFVVI
jgi:hypothetical protein